jgi:hypothetical protein
MKLGERKKERKKNRILLKKFVADYWQLSLKIWRLGIYLKAKRRIMETCS